MWQSLNSLVPEAAKMLQKRVTSAIPMTRKWKSLLQNVNAQKRKALRQSFATAPSLKSKFDIPNTTLMYTADIGKRQSISFKRPVVGTLEMVATEQSVKDARSLDPSPTISNYGFQLVNHETSLSNKDFYLSGYNKIQQVYYKEIIDAVKKVFPDAADVKVVHHQVRKSTPDRRLSGESKEDEQHATPGRQAEFVHCDYSARSAIEALKMTAPTEYLKGRYIIVSAWRNISEASIQNNHLAVCDGRTIANPDDIIPVDLDLGGIHSELYCLNPLRKDCHQWYYYPLMTKSEVLVLTLFDSNWKATPRFTFHTSITDPGAPKDAQQRESIECRCFVFFPDFQPNTVYGTSGEKRDFVDNAIYKILQSLKYASAWPVDGKLWMGTQLYAENGVESVINVLVKESAKQGHHDLDKASDEQINEVIDKLLSSGDFEQMAKSAFPRISAEDAAVRSILTLAETLEHLPHKSLDWLKSTLDESKSFEEAIREILNRKEMQQNPFVASCTEEEKENVIQKLLNNSQFERKVKKALQK